MESDHDLISLFEHGLRANAFRVCREGKPASTHRVKPEGMLFRIMLQNEKRPRGDAALFLDIVFFDIGVGQDSPGKRPDEITQFAARRLSADDLPERRSATIS